MPLELKIPSVGESISEVQIGEWHKAEGESVAQDENLVELESEKATFDLPAPAAGVVSKILKRAGDTAAVGEVIGYLESTPAAEAKTMPVVSPARAKDQPETRSVDSRSREGVIPASAASKTHTRETELAQGAGTPPAEQLPTAPDKVPTRGAETRVMPAARRALAQHGVRAEQVTATGPGGRLLKEDVERHAAEAHPQSPEQPASEPPVSEDRGDETVPMSPIRRRIAQRLVEAQHTAALLTTFNEVDLSAVMELRRKFKDAFQEKYGAKLGVMSFFVKAAIDALRDVPQVNAEIRESNIVYHNYYDIGIAVGGGKGLVVPVLRNAERLSFAEIEVAIGDFAKRAAANTLTVEELRGGTFTISNGGVYGSLLSTPIVNPPQSGVLGLHAIQDRPVAREGAVVIRPMMYVALTYDHRIVDGREAVTFLKRIKDAVEEPARMLIEV